MIHSPAQLRTWLDNEIPVLVDTYQRPWLPKFCRVLKKSSETTQNLMEKRTKLLVSCLIPEHVIMFLLTEAARIWREISIEF